jgi:hypothetical protein
MDWQRFEAALIRAFWSVVFPAIGVGVDRLYNWATEENLQSIGVENFAIATAISAVLYGMKRYFWPGTKW